MPYIAASRREALDHWDHPRTEGELNYAVTKLVIAYVKAEGLSYATCNDIVGALDNAKDEFKRRVQNPYEDSKIVANGDVYPDYCLTEVPRSCTCGGTGGNC